MKLVLAARETTTLGGGQKIISEIDEKRPLKWNFGRLSQNVKMFIFLVVKLLFFTKKSVHPQITGFPYSTLRM